MTDKERGLAISIAGDIVGLVSQGHLEDAIEEAELLLQILMGDYTP